MTKLSSQQALTDAIVAAAKHKDGAADTALIVELAGRGLAAPESISLDDIKVLCRNVIAQAVERTRRTPS